MELPDLTPRRVIAILVVSVIGILGFLYWVIAIGPVNVDSDTTEAVASSPVTTPRRTTTSTAAGGYSDSSIEYQLATIDAGRSLPNDDTRIDQYDEVLDRVQQVCGNGRRMLGDMAVRGRQILAEEGVSVSAYELLDGVAIALDGQPRQSSCAETFSVIMVLIQG